MCVLIHFNSGIGRGAALALARDGAKVVVNYHKDQKAAEAVVAAIKSIGKGSDAIAIQADVSKSGDVDRLFTTAKTHFGRIDIVFANSGISGNLFINNLLIYLHTFIQSNQSLSSPLLTSHHMHGYMDMGLFIYLFLVVI
jgi:NAD(P)-dependent dehydrogenase (short-subunit alcohol dehydrogenase family)